VTGTHVVGFAFKPGSRVKLKALDLPATVSGCMVESAGLQYRIVWWSDGTRKCEWLHDFEVLPL